MDLEGLDGIVVESDVVEEVIVPTQETTDLQPITISRDKFNTLVNCIGLTTSLTCTDCLIINGWIRQTTDSQTNVIKMDLTSLIGDRSLELIVAKEKYGVLNALKVDDSAEWSQEDIIIDEDARSYSIIETASTIRFPKPVQDLIDNKNLTQEQIDAKALATDENKVFSLNISRQIVNRISSICESLQTDIVIFELEGEKGSVIIKSKNSNDQVKCTVIKDFPLLQETPKFSFNLNAIAFKNNKDSEATLDFHVRPDGGAVAILNQVVFGSIDFTMYLMTQIEQ